MFGFFLSIIEVVIKRATNAAEMREREKRSTGKRRKNKQQKRCIG